MTADRTRIQMLAPFALLGAPLAFWLASSSGYRAAVAETARSPATDSKPPSAAPMETGPSDYCVTRLLTPLLSMAGEVAPPDPARAEAQSGPNTRGSDLDRERWLSRLVGATDKLRATLKTGGAPVVIETLIATIPDPIDSGLFYHFETALQALRAGFESEVEPQAAPTSASAAPRGYFRDRSFLPWDDRERSDAQRADSESCRTALPGLMLFRNSDLDHPSVLIVFLVGETPTSGVRGAPLLNALRVAARIAPALGPTEPRALTRVIGPTYSGSAYSLRVALDKFAREQPGAISVRIISGTASGAVVPQLLNHTQVFGANDSAASLSYAATTVPEAAADCAYLWFLRGRLGVEPRPPAADDSTRVLSGVASLRESGTEFGASGPNAGANASTCGLQPELTLSFPVHVSFLRDAYEDLDRRDGAVGTESGIARSTSLGPALREPRTPLDAEANPSAKTRAALDVMLSNLLSEVSRRGIRHVSIHATDVGDAIFLARKLRDVAPDVRLAFFQPDDILLHPKFRADLLGSLVVSPYPFLGVSDFRISAVHPRSHLGFTSAAAQGIFNAVLAQRGVRAETLFDYAFAEPAADGSAPDLPAAPLLIWVSTIARTGLVPVDVKPPLDCAKTIYGTREPAPVDAVCRAARELAAAHAAGGDEVGARKRMRRAWGDYNEVRASSLPIDPALELPRFWNFLYMAIVFGFFLDHTRQGRSARSFAEDTMPPSFDAGDERAADRAIGRTKWTLYATIRTFLFVLAFCYMGTVYLLAFIARDGLHPRGFWDFASSLTAAVFICFVPLIAGFFCVRSAREFVGDYRAFARYVAEPVFPWSLAAWRAGFSSGRISSSGKDEPKRRPQYGADSSIGSQRWTMSVGLAPPLGRSEAARVSFAQLRIVALFTLSLAGGFTVCLVMNSLAAADSSNSLLRTAVPMLTLSVLRNVPLLNGVSPAAPALLSIGCVYVWAVGRMARLALAHGISRISPPDGETDLVSTPIRLLLYPTHVPGLHHDDGFTRAERDLLNSIWRPITGRYYVFGCFAVIFFPILLFALKPLSTLEAVWGTWLLGGGLALSAALNGITLIQLIQYWVCLERLLKRTLAHELGPVFARLPDFVRDSIDRQISRSSNDLLRWVACVRQFEQLLALLTRSDSREATTLRCRVNDKDLQARTQTALVMADAPDASGREDIELAERVIETASAVAHLLKQPAQQATPLEAELAHAAAEQPRVEQIAVGHDSVPDGERNCIAPLARHAAAASATRLEQRSAEFALAATSYEAPHSGPAPKSPRSAASDSGPAPAGSTVAANAEEPAWVPEAQVFVATVTTLLIQRHVRQFGHFMFTLVATALLMLLTVTSYPFEPYRLLLTCIWVVVGSVVVTGLWVYTQLHRNTLLSMMSGTSPGKVTFSSGVALRVVAWAVVPLLSVAAAQYPNFANQLFQLIAPFARTFK